MSEELETSRGKNPSTWKVVLYGTPGSGKSTLATFAPKPFFVDLEGGLDRIDCWKTKRRIETFEGFMQALRWVITQADVGTVVIDTLDELDNILQRKVCEREGKTTLVDIPYGKGGDLLVREWAIIIGICEKIRERGKNVLLIGHEQILKFEDPVTENYDRYCLKIHKKSAPLLCAKVDAVLFCRYEVFTKEKDDGRGNRGVGGDRVLHCLEAPCWMAKNRFGLPATVPMDASLFEKII